MFIFKSVPNIPKRVTDSDLSKYIYDYDELTEWTAARISKSRPGEPGDLSQVVVVPDNLIENATHRFSEHYFNVVANELMPLDRTLIDFRQPE